MPFTEDLSQFVDPDEHGTTAQYKGSVSVNGIFDNGSYVVSGDAAVEGTQPTFLCVEADVPALEHDEEFLIDGVTYYVDGIKPDGTGMVLIALRLAE
ncbi:MAG: head-tail joining protein [Pseudomonadota bacterium]